MLFMFMVPAALSLFYLANNLTLYKYSIVNFVVFCERFLATLCLQGVSFYFLVNNELETFFLCLMLCIWLLFGDVLFLFIEISKCSLMKKRSKNIKIIKIKDKQIFVFNIIKDKKSLIIFLVFYAYLILTVLFLFIKNQKIDEIRGFSEALIFFLVILCSVTNYLSFRAYLKICECYSIHNSDA